jgi:hypothetical protein
LEMWFWLDFFIYDNAFDKNYIDKLWFSNWNNELIKKKIEEKLIWKDNFSISFFRNAEDMYDNIKNKEVSLLYSDTYFDERIIKLWINQFNVKNFHLGYIWALETIKELISLSEMKYFKLLNKYIK